MPLTLRRTKLKQPNGEPVQDDYTVYEDGKIIGRIYKTNRYGTDEWFWGNNRFPNSSADRGHAEGLEHAKAAFRAAWERKA